LDKYFTLHNIKIPKFLDCQVSKLKRRAHAGTIAKKDMYFGNISLRFKLLFIGERFILTFVDDYSRNSRKTNQKFQA